MPYRRLPNTDMARLRALKSGLKVGESVPPHQLAYSSATYLKVKHFLPQFENMYYQQRSSLQSQINKSREYNAITRKARLYISHFFQVLNFAIARNEIPASARKLFGIKENDSRIPPLVTENDIVFWGEKLLKGEAERTSKGANPMTNPSAAIVRVRYEQFIQAMHSQKVLQKSTSYASDRIAGMRAEADQIIISIWDEVEQTYSMLPDDDKREKASAYGVVYVFRPHERENNENISNATAEDLNDDLIENDDLNTTRLNEYNKLQQNIQKQQLQYSIAFQS